MIILLHNKESKESRDFLEANKDSISQVIDWYGDKDAYMQYALSGLEQPSGFPTIVYKKTLCREPESVQWAKDEIDGKHETEQQKLDALVMIPRLTIRRAMRALEIEDKLDLILTNADFKKDWDDATEIDLNEDMVKNAMAQMEIDTDAIKKQILGLL